ncbi:MAG: FtsX-like permease family protein [Pirellulales bacterium]|nr:FtsX-like permease family protein [Pirellulales bacterium]
MWSLAIHTLIADRGKLLTALVGVVFSIVLVNVQGGLFIGLIRKAGLLVDQGQADVWVGHRQMHNVDFPRDIPRRWVHRIRTIPGVHRAEPYLVGFADMTLPSGGFEGVVVVGVDRASLLGNAWNLVEGRPDAILQPDGIILDECENQKLENPKIGELREVGGRRARVVAKSQGIMGFLVAPYIFTTYDRAADYLAKTPDMCSYFLVQLEPGARADEVCQAIRRVLPEVDAFPRDEYSRISIDFWMTRTGLGISFGAATLLGLLVGMIMVAQTLYALVLDRLGEFGTLKAIGATERQVYSVLLIQAFLMAVVGAIIGLVLVSGIQFFYSTPRAPIVVPWWLSLGSCVLVLVICLVSSWLPYHRIRKLDPMMVLQS